MFIHPLTATFYPLTSRKVPKISEMFSALKRFFGVRSPAQQFEDLRKATIAVLSGVTKTHKHLPKDIAEYIIQFLELSEFRIRLVSSLKNESGGYGIIGVPGCRTDEFYERDLITRNPIEDSRIIIWRVSYHPKSPFILVMLPRSDLSKFLKVWFNDPNIKMPPEGEFGHRKYAVNQICPGVTSLFFIISEPHEFNGLFMTHNS